jgi:hypothetical protein
MSMNLGHMATQGKSLYFCSVSNAKEGVRQSNYISSVFANGSLGTVR